MAPRSRSGRLAQIRCYYGAIGRRYGTRRCAGPERGRHMFRRYPHIETIFAPRVCLIQMSAAPAARRRHQDILKFRNFLREELIMRQTFAFAVVLSAALASSSVDAMPVQPAISAPPRRSPLPADAARPPGAARGGTAATRPITAGCRMAIIRPASATGALRAIGTGRGPLPQYAVSWSSSRRRLEVI